MVYIAIGSEKIRDQAILSLPKDASAELEIIQHWGKYGINSCK